MPSLRSLFSDSLLADRSDNYHKQARKEFSILEKNQYRIALVYPTMMESYTLIMRYLGVKYAHRWLDSFIHGSVLLNPTPTDYQHAAQQVSKYLDQKITLFDAVYRLSVTGFECLYGPTILTST